MVSYCVAFDGNLLQIIKANDKATINVIGLQEGKKRLDVLKKISWCPRRASAVHSLQILDFGAIEELSTGNGIAAVLVTIKPSPAGACDNSFSTYILAVDVENELIIPLLRVKLTLEEYSSYCKVSLVDGPAVFTVSPSDVAFHIAEDGESHLECHKLALLSSLSSQCQKYCGFSNQKLLSAEKLLCQIVDVKQYLVVGKWHFICNSMCKKHDKNIENWDLFAFLFTIRSTKPEWICLDARLLLPSEYSSTISCLRIRRLDVKKKEGQQEFEVDSHLYAGTAEGHVLEFNSGSLTRCVALDIESPLAVTSISFDCENYLVALQGDRVTSFRLSELQVDKKWQGITSAVFGDFLTLGRRQLLLAEGENILEDSWLLTDFEENLVQYCDTEYGDEVNESEEGAVDSGQTVVEALEHTVQQNGVCLDGWSHELDKRLSFLQDSFHRQAELLGMCGVTQTEKYTTELLPLIHGSKSLPEIQTSEKADVHGCLMVTEIWSRTYTGRWVIGVDFYNTFDRTLQVSVSLLPSGGDRRYHSITSYSKPCYVATTRGDNSKVIHTACCVTPIPNFGASDNFSVNVCLTWSLQDSPKNNGTKCRSSPSDEGVCSTDTESADDRVKKLKSLSSQKQDLENRNSAECVESSDDVCSKLCGQITLTAADVIGGRQELQFLSDHTQDDVEMDDETELQRDRTAWKSVQCQYKMSAVSTPHILTALPQQLKDRCSCTYSSRYGCYSFNSIPLLQAVQLSLGQPDLGQLPVTVFAGCDKDVFLLLHHLYSCLHDNMMFIPQQVLKEHTLQSYLPSMLHEHHILSEGIQTLLDMSKKSSASGTADVTDEDDIRKVGEKFKLRKEKVNPKPTFELSAASMKTCLRKMKNACLKTDQILAHAAIT